MNLGQWLGLLAFVIALYILWQVRQLLLLLFTAVVLATVLNQVVKRFRRSGVQRVWAVALTFGSLIVILGLVAWLIVPPFIDQFQQLIQLAPSSWQQLEARLSWIEARVLRPFFPGIPDIGSLLDQFQPEISALLQRSLDFFSASLEALVQIFLVLVLTLMLLVNPQPYRDLFIRLFPAFYRRQARETLDRCEETLGQWAIGALAEMMFVGTLSGIGLLILGVPLVLANALIAGLLNFIPNIGPTLSVILPMAVALLDTPWKALAVLILYTVIQQIESYWLTPTVMAKQVSLLPAVTLTVQIFFASFFGFLGLLIALPLAVVAKVWLETVLIHEILDRWQRPRAS